MSTKYSSLLSDLIDKSGLSLTEISQKAEEQHGQKITTSYLSKLKNGKMPPPSFKMTIALALTLDVDPEVLLSAGMLDNKEANKDDLKKSLEELYPDMEPGDILEKVWEIIYAPHQKFRDPAYLPTEDEYKEIFSTDEQNLLDERDLSLESIKGKYNLEIDGKPATDEEIEEMIKHIKIFRIYKETESS